MQNSSSFFILYINTGHGTRILLSAVLLLGTLLHYLHILVALVDLILWFPTLEHAYVHIHAHTYVHIYKHMHTKKGA
jgi:hypothetical protein